MELVRLILEGGWYAYGIFSKHCGRAEFLPYLVIPSGHYHCVEERAEASRQQHIRTQIIHLNQQ